MELIQRLGCQWNDEYVDDYIAEIKKHKGSCDHVWLPTSYAYPPLEKHREYADFHIRQAAKFRANGISVSLQLSNSLGHGDTMLASDCTGLYYDGSPAEHMVGHDGTVAKVCWCPRGKHFREYLGTSLAYYAELQPTYIWVDDDFRAKGHGTVRFGCFCDDCISAFNTANGVSFTREELVATIYADLDVRARWIAFTRESLADLLADIAAHVHAVSPNTLFCSQHGPYGAYTGHSLDFVFDAMKQANGGIAPMSRPGGGTYNDRDPNKIFHKALALAYQNSYLPDYVVRKAPEIESLPFNAFGKSPAGTALETTVYLAAGNTDMSYSMLMHTPEPMSYYGKMFRAFSEHRPYWERLSECNKSTYGGGIRHFQSENIWRRPIGEGEDFAVLNEEPYTELEDLMRDAVPFTFDKEEERVFFLHPETARDLGEEELAYLLSHNVITDGESIDVLQKRGFALGVDCCVLEDANANCMQERFAAHPLAPKYKETYKTSPYSRGRKTRSAMRPVEGCEILATYEPTSALATPVYPGEEYPYGIAEMIISTETGGKWAILGYCPWRNDVPSFKRDMLLDIADYISGNALPARLVTPVACVLWPRCDREGRTVAVSIANRTVGETEEMELLVRRPVGKRFTLMSQYDGTHTLTARREGEDYILTLPSLRAWSMATVFVDE